MTHGGGKPPFILGIMMHKPFVTPLFPTILHTLDMIGFNKELLLDYVANEQSKSPEGVFKSNHGGWQSEDTYHQFDNPIRQILHKNLSIIFPQEVVQADAAGLYVLNMWINVNGHGNDNIAHIHSGSNLSGVFWINVPEDGGCLQFESPHSFTCWTEHNWYNRDFRKGFNAFMNYDVYPVEGRMCIFPSSLYHRVLPNQSEDPRVSVSFNIQLGSNSSM